MPTEIKRTEALEDYHDSRLRRRNFSPKEQEIAARILENVKKFEGLTSPDDTILRLFPQEEIRKRFNMINVDFDKGKVSFLLTDRGGYHMGIPHFSQKSADFRFVLYRQNPYDGTIEDEWYFDHEFTPELLDFIDQTVARGQITEDKPKPQPKKSLLQKLLRR